jgi:hypothetical protein
MEIILLARKQSRLAMVYLSLVYAAAVVPVVLSGSAQPLFLVILPILAVLFGLEWRRNCLARYRDVDGFQYSDKGWRVLLRDSWVPASITRHVCYFGLVYCLSLQLWGGGRRSLRIWRDSVESSDWETLGTCLAINRQVSLNGVPDNPPS